MQKLEEREGVQGSLAGQIDRQNRTRHSSQAVEHITPVTNGAGR